MHYGFWFTYTCISYSRKSIVWKFGWKMPCVLLSLLLLSPVLEAADPDLPYNEKADAKEMITRAYAGAAAREKPVMIVFGANWCPDCRALDKAMHEPDIQDLVERYFQLVKVDVGNWDKNLDVVAEYDNPIQGGIPSLVVTDIDRKILFMTKGGQLASARSMGHDTLLKFFQTLSRLQP